MQASEVSAATSNGGLDVIVRMHDPTRGFELRRAIFALVCQTYRPLSIHLVTQRFPESELIAIRQVLDKILAIDPSVCFDVYNYTAADPEDARGAMLNAGLGRAMGRYVAFLDYDDTIYPSAYLELVQELNATGSAIAFAGIATKTAELLQDAVVVQQRIYRLVGRTLIDMFTENFCPLHSFIVDRSRIDPQDLWFDEQVSKMEDYEFLLRVCSKYKSSFGLIEKISGDYYLKTDGSNTSTIPVEDSASALAWQKARAFIENRRGELVMSPIVQRSLGIYPPDSGLTIRKLLDSFA